VLTTEEKSIIKMAIKRLIAESMIIVLILYGCNAAFGENAEITSQEKQEYDQDYKRVADMDASISQSDVRDINSYEEFADRIDQKWRGRNKEYHARLMLEICNPLSSGTFSEKRRYLLARKYALSALAEPDSISLGLELKLTGHMVILFYGPDAPSGYDFAQKRTENTALRVHAWKRLLEAINPDWDPNKDTLYINVAPPPATGLSPGVDPAAIEDSALRAEYEESIRINRQKIESYTKQYKYRQYLGWYQNSAEENIIQEYSYPPYAIGELREMLNDGLPDQEAKARILEAVEKNMREGIR
jgi:hypothetical protein